MVVQTEIHLVVINQIVKWVNVDQQQVIQEEQQDKKQHHQDLLANLNLKEQKLGFNT